MRKKKPKAEKKRKSREEDRHSKKGRASAGICVQGEVSTEESEEETPDSDLDKIKIEITAPDHAAPGGDLSLRTRPLSSGSESEREHVKGHNVDGSVVRSEQVREEEHEEEVEPGVFVKTKRVSYKSLFMTPSILVD